MLQRSSETQNKTAAQIIAHAFLHYPLMLFAFEGKTEQKRALLLNKLYDKCVSAAVMYGRMEITNDKTAAVIWLPGKSFPLTLLKEIKSGMAVIPIELGLRSTMRLVQHDGESEGWIRKNTGANIGYIWCIGVLPEARGKGFSRLLIDKSITEMKQQGLTECWLKTEDAKNVVIYQKLGFTVMNEMVVKSSGITSWAMRRMI